MPKKLWGITSHWPQWPLSKRSTKNNYCRECTENKILPQSWWDINDEAMMENSMEVPWNTKHRGTVWSCNPIPQCRCRENHHSKWHVYLDFQGSTIYNSQDTESIKMSIDRKMKTTWYIYTLKCYLAIKQNKIMTLAAAWIYQEIIILYILFREKRTKS